VLRSSRPASTSNTAPTDLGPCADDAYWPDPDPTAANATVHDTQPSTSSSTLTALLSQDFLDLYWPDPSQDSTFAHTLKDPTPKTLLPLKTPGAKPCRIITDYFSVASATSSFLSAPLSSSLVRGTIP
jgi:hypothetical protein